MFNEKKRQGLLNKWRTKVYELLVQLKTQEINYKQDKHIEEKTIEECMAALDDQTTRNRILENIIEDKKAELTVLSNDHTALGEQLSTLKDEHSKLELMRREDLQSTIELNKFVNSLMKQYSTIEESFKLASKKLNHLDQRVEFAKNRLGVIKALHGQKEAKRTANMLEMTSNLSSIHGSINNPKEQSNIVRNSDSQNADKSILEIVNEADIDEEENENLNFIREELTKVS
jgi:DNA repair exonuclease SbcCD ATPase subunit